MDEDMNDDIDDHEINDNNVDEKSSEKSVENDKQDDDNDYDEEEDEEEEFDDSNDEDYSYMPSKKDKTKYESQKTNNKLSKCQYCDKYISRRNRLAIHIEKRHGFQCDICQER